MRILVTGATGFIGRHVVARLLELGVDVTAVARGRDTAAQMQWIDRVRFVAWDLHRDPTAAPDGLLVPYDAAMHLSWTGLPNYRSSHHIDENVHLDLRFLQALLPHVPRLLVTGTCYEYGYQSGKLSEDYPAAPNNPYAMAKDMVRRCLAALQAQRPFTLQWARLFYTYGPGQNPQSLLAQLDAAIDRGDRSFKMSEGKQVRDYLPVEKVAGKLVALALTDADGIFNVCSGVPVTVLELVRQHLARRGASIELELGYYPYPEHEPMAFWGDSTRLERALQTAQPGARPVRNVLP